MGNIPIQCLPSNPFTDCGTQTNTKIKYPSNNLPTPIHCLSLIHTQLWILTGACMPTTIPIKSGHWISWAVWSLDLFIIYIFVFNLISSLTSSLASVHLYLAKGLCLLIRQKCDRDFIQLPQPTSDLVFFSKIIYDPLTSEIKQAYYDVLPQ